MSYLSIKSITYKSIKHMKKLIIAAFLVPLLLSPKDTRAQNQVIKINFLSLVIKTLNVSYEKVLDTNNSMQLGVYFTGASNDNTDFTGFGITPEYRFYLSETEAPNGVYVAPFLRYSSFTIEDNISISKATLTSFTGGLVIGRQWIFKEKISFDVFLGPKYSNSSLKLKSGTDTFSTGAFDGFGLRFGVTLGLAF